MGKLIITIIFSLSSIYASIKDPISIGDISFTAAQWDDFYNIRYSTHKISNYTSTQRAVILYLFEACFS
jgi:hypothetical protein